MKAAGVFGLVFHTGRVWFFIFQWTSFNSYGDFKDVAVKSNLFTSASQNIRLDTVVAGLKVPWGMAFLPDGEMLIRNGVGGNLLGRRSCPS